MTNVAAGRVSATSTDAVNGSQLNAAYQGINLLSASTSTSISSLSTAVGSGTGGGNAVQYNDAGRTSVTLGGIAATAPVRLTNVAAGSLATTSTDAVNGSQLGSLSTSTSTGLVSLSTGIGSLSTGLSTTNSSLTSLSTVAANAVQYDDATHGVVTLGGAGSVAPVRLTNVAAGSLAAGSTDAVNGGQLGLLSTSTSTGLGSLSTGLSTTNSTVASLSTLGQNAVLYDDASHTAVTLGGASATAPVRLTNVAAGSLAATSTDAVNGSQLGSLSTSTLAGLNSLSTSTSTAFANLQTGGTENAVQYDDFSRAVVTFGGANATTPVRLTNVAAGSLAADSTDAVNGSQLGSLSTSTSTGLSTTNSTVASLSTSASTGLGSLSTSTSTAFANLSTGTANAVQYNDATHTAVTLGGASATAPVRLTNVAAGSLAADSTDAVNGAQLGSLSTSTSTGLSSLSTGLSSTNSTIASLSSLSGNVVEYNDASHTAVTFGGTSATAPVRLTNVAAGSLAADSTDAVNGSQLGSLSTVTSTGLGSLSTGLSTTRFDLSSLSTSTSTAFANLSTGGSTNAVQYNDVSRTAVTLGGTSATAPVRLTNVAAGSLAADSTDAVNGSQLGALSTSTSTGLGSLSTGLSSTNSTVTALSTSASTGLGSLSTSTSTAFANLSTGAANAVQYNDASRSIVTLGGTSATAPVRLTNVAAGSLAANSTDAINGSQLGSLSTSTSTGLSTVGFNLASLSTSTSTAFANLSAGGSGFNAVQYNDVNHDAVTFGGAAAQAPVRLMNVAAGSLAANSTDAVNGSQLGALSTSLSTTNFNLSALSTSTSTAIANITVNGGGSPNAVQYDDASHTKATLGGTSATGTVGLTNVSDGSLASDSTDAVNGRQLGSLSTSTSTGLASLSTALSSIGTGGGSLIGGGGDTGGTPRPPAKADGDGSLAVGGGSSASGGGSTAVGSDSNANGDKTTAIGSGSSASNQGTAIGAGAVASGANSVALGAGSIADQPNTVSVGSPGHERRIVNVADGIADTDAANMRQLRAVEYRVDRIERNTNAGIAGAMAMAMMPQPTDPGKSMVSASLGGYDGEGALAVGVSRVSEDGDWVFKGGATVNTRDKTGAGVSVGYQW
ncbi:YadA-like family protein [Luteimonas sp. RC10]|uniref:YadA-like family protein n=1 Tax=Luteimonas sp. RC10 TaxID=2587035 RepID=UPI0018220F0F|nr:YadA-like family protein [Luteimonas sp. RC10]MBB3342167.1 autotransporter adhesin [Luteimonas sp. RC10]